MAEDEVLTNAFAMPLPRAAQSRGAGPLVSIGLELADPDPDQLPRDVMPLRQRVQRLSRHELLSNLPFERRAMRIDASSWLPSSGSPAVMVNSNPSICPPPGAHSTPTAVMARTLAGPAATNAASRRI